MHRSSNVPAIMKRLRGLCRNGALRPQHARTPALISKPYQHTVDILCRVCYNARTGLHRNLSLSRESSWCNPLLNPLPNAPSMTIYCFGSRDRPTEIAYLMKDQTEQLSAGQARSEMWSRPISTVIANASGHMLLETTKGDGTIPWLSQTLMCSDEEAHGLRGWKGNPDLNPFEVQVKRYSVFACRVACF